MKRYEKKPFAYFVRKGRLSTYQKKLGMGLDAKEVYEYGMWVPKWNGTKDKLGREPLWAVVECYAFDEYEHLVRRADKNNAAPKSQWLADGIRKMGY